MIKKIFIILCLVFLLAGCLTKAGAWRVLKLKYPDAIQISAQSSGDIWQSWVFYVKWVVNGRCAYKFIRIQEEAVPGGAPGERITRIDAVMDAGDADWSECRIGAENE